MRNKILISALILGMAFIAGVVYTANKQKQQALSEIHSFDDCMAAGNPIMETYPAQCRTQDGRTFVQQISPTTSPESEPKEGSPTPITQELKPSDTASPGMPGAVTAVLAHLAQRLSIQQSAITIIEAEETEWPNGCLGVTDPDVMCTQVITPGFKITLEAQGKQYVYHTNTSGSSYKVIE